MNELFTELVALVAIVLHGAGARRLARWLHQTAGLSVHVGWRVALLRRA